MVDDEECSTGSTRGIPDVEQNNPRFTLELSVPYSDVPVCSVRTSSSHKVTALLYLSELVIINTDFKIR
jgi:hypothetical protein